jgi:aspartyl-tRNA(Asn)/glutamyl-tRNA(Gln) amidotransferase subunit C
MITTAEIQKLAELARLKIAPEEQESLRSEIESILGYVDQIKKAAQVSGDSKNAGSPVVGVGTLHNVMREDGEPHRPSEFTEKILSVAPARGDGADGNYLKVKKIM